jgi:hypothetical protein
LEASSSFAEAPSLAEREPLRVVEQEVVIAGSAAPAAPVITPEARDALLEKVALVRQRSPQVFDVAASELEASSSFAEAPSLAEREPLRVVEQEVVIAGSAAPAAPVITPEAREALLEKVALVRQRSHHPGDIAAVEVETSTSFSQAPSLAERSPLPAVEHEVVIAEGAAPESPPVHVEKSKQTVAVAAAAPAAKRSSPEPKPAVAVAKTATATRPSAASHTTTTTPTPTRAATRSVTAANTRVHTAPAPRPVTRTRTRTDGLAGESLHAYTSRQRNGAAAPSRSEGSYSVLVLESSDRRQAESWRSRLAKAGEAAFVSIVLDPQSGPRFRVLLGRYETLAQARQTLARANRMPGIQAVVLNGRRAM